MRIRFPRRWRFGVCFSIAGIGACPNEDFVSAGIAISDYSDRLLASVIEATPNEDLTFLVTEYGKPFTAAGFGGWFREMCDAAGLPRRCAAHGLRKAACRRLAEAGCSANIIAAISGHKTLREVERYTQAADQARMARAGMERTIATFPTTERRTFSVKPESKV